MLAWEASGGALVRVEKPIPEPGDDELLVRVLASAEYATVPAGWAYPLMDLDFLKTAPSGGRLGIYGFGASAHLTAQVALYEGARVHVVTRSPQAQELALTLGAASASGGR